MQSFVEGAAFSLVKRQLRGTNPQFDPSVLAFDIKPKAPGERLPAPEGLRFGN